jgi:hypothetical protein
MPFPSTPARRALALCLGLGTVAVGATGFASAAPSATLAPSDDVYATVKKPDRNFGVSRYLIVTRTPATRSYIRFKLDSLPASSLRATLRVYPLTSARNGLRLRRAADTAWAEQDLTFRSSPTTERAAVHSGALRARHWKDIDVTRLVGHSGVVSLALSTSGRERIVLASRESGSRAPRLIVRKAASANSVAPVASGPTLSAAPGPVLPPPVPVPTAQPTPPSEAVVAAAGDIATTPTSGEVTAKLLDILDPAAVLTLGDNAYTAGTMSQFMNFYDPTWGRHNAKVKPAPGNHEYNSGGTGYFDYFGPRAGPRGYGYYSYDVGGWHLIALNSNIARDVGSAQETWLRNDLAANSTQCTLAYWHHPRWDLYTKGNDATQAALWNALYDNGADVVLDGHAHNYQRYSRLDKNGSRDDARGIRQFTVGTGGAPHSSSISLKPPAEVVNSDTFGVLKLTLRPGSYDWNFMPEAGKTFTDSGSEGCH